MPLGYGRLLPLTIFECWAQHGCKTVLKRCSATNTDVRLGNRISAATTIPVGKLPLNGVHFITVIHRKRSNYRYEIVILGGGDTEKVSLWSETEIPRFRVQPGSVGGSPKGPAGSTVAQGILVAR